MRLCNWDIGRRVPTKCTKKATVTLITEGGHRADFCDKHIGRIVRNEARIVNTQFSNMVGAVIAPLEDEDE